MPPNPKTPIYPNSSLSPWARQPPIVPPPSILHPYSNQDQLPKEIHDQVHLVKTIQQSLETEQQKLEWMINRFQASNQGFQPAQHSMKQILSNRGPIYPSSSLALRKEGMEHFRIEDLVVEEVNKRRSNSNFE
jgi:hypothetical protein